jgi:hypothetical protein
MTNKPNFIIVNSSDIAKDKNLNLSPKYWIDKKNPLNKETQDKMREFVKKNSKDKLKEVIKEFYRK